MKKTIFALCSLLLVFGSANAQKTETGEKPAAAQVKENRPRLTVEERAKNRTEKLNEQCKLSADQFKSIMQINTNFFTQKEKIVKSPEAKDAIRALARERNQKENAVLTPEQAAKWKAFVASQKKGNDGKVQGAAPAEKEHEE